MFGGSKKNQSWGHSNPCKWLALGLLAVFPMLTGCNWTAISLLTYGNFFLWDVALIPVRSGLGTLALDIINSF